MKRAAIISAGWNVLFAFGAALVAFGFWLAWHPLGFIFAGIFVGIVAYGGGFEQALKGRR